MGVKTKPCECGKLMILHETGFSHMTYPPNYERVWWCKCGRSEHGPWRRGKTDEERREEAWKAAQED